MNRAIQLTTLLRGIEQDQLSAAEKREDNARANVTMVHNLLKDGKVAYDKLPEDTRLAIKNMEIQAGFPAGFTKFVTDTIDAPKVDFLGSYTDADGYRIQPVGKIKADGSYSIVEVKLRKAKDGKEEKRVISQEKLNELANAGVPNDVALWVQGSINNGVDLEVIRRKLAETLGREKGYGYLDRFGEVMKFPE